MKYVFIWLIRFYQMWISPLKPPCCRFSPTCSAYAMEAFMKRGFFVGIALSFWRILRCNPFGKPGYDPVPDKGFKRVPVVSREKEISVSGDKIPDSSPSVPETSAFENNTEHFS